MRLLAVLDDFAECFTETPGHCTLVAHEIRVSDNFQPKASRAYRVPEVLKEETERQVAQLLELDFIQPSRSPMSSGVVCVVKPDKSIRLACDYRYLNAHTIGDAFPMHNLTAASNDDGERMLREMQPTSSDTTELLKMIALTEIP